MSPEMLTCACDFDNDRNVDSTAMDPVFTYNNPGTCPVRLMVTNSAGSDKALREKFLTVQTAVPAFPALALPVLAVPVPAAITLVYRKK
jgi:PKD repeat protein